MMLVLGGGCATKAWVEQQDAQLDQKIEQGIERGIAQASANAVAASTTQVRASLDRERTEQARRDRERSEAMEVRLRAVERSVVEAKEASRVSLARADDAVARAEAADSRLTRLWAGRHARKAVNFLNIKFGFNDSALDDLGKSTLLALVHEMKDNPTLTVDLEGYTDPKGAREYNLKLSRRRVEAVQRYLEEQGVSPRRIHAVARGPVNDPGVSDEAKRRVLVKIMLDAE
jgi:outer membrane protein OmpA-like peptidoglycan-associated protein